MREPPQSLITSGGAGVIRGEAYLVSYDTGYTQKKGGVPPRSTEQHEQLAYNPEKCADDHTGADDHCAKSHGAVLRLRSDQIG